MEILFQLSVSVLLIWMPMIASTALRWLSNLVIVWSILVLAMAMRKQSVPLYKSVSSKASWNVKTSLLTQSYGSLTETVLKMLSRKLLRLSVSITLISLWFITWFRTSLRTLLWSSVSACKRFGAKWSTVRRRNLLEALVLWTAQLSCSWRSSLSVTLDLPSIVLRCTLTSLKMRPWSSTSSWKSLLPLSHPLLPTRTSRPTSYSLRASSSLIWWTRPWLRTSARSTTSQLHRSSLTGTCTMSKLSYPVCVLSNTSARTVRFSALNSLRMKSKRSLLSTRMLDSTIAFRMTITPTSPTGSEERGFYYLWAQIPLEKKVN